MAELYSFANLHRAYRACRRNKRNTLNALAFEVDAEAELLHLQGALRAHSYRPGPSICFVTEGPKPREVFAADFRDRIVHHVLVDYQQPIFERLFIHDSFACRPGKGTLAASDRLMQFLRQATANGRRPAWALKLDIASFFASIHKQTLYEVIAHRIRNSEVLWLTRTVLFHDPTRDYRFRSRGRRCAGPGQPGYPVAPRKSLFGTDNQRGLPIGNLSSQFWANVYLNELDRFAKRTLGCRWYVRYVDDLVLLADGPSRLDEWRAAIDTFVQEHLRLALRPGHQEPFRTGLGIEFVGWRTWWSHRVVRRQTTETLRRRLAGFHRHHVQPAFAGRALRVNLAERPVAALGRVLASYAGHLRHGATGRDWNDLRSAFAWLDLLFGIGGGRAALRLRPGRPPSSAAEYRRLVIELTDGCLLFFRCGRYIEFYGPQRLLAQSVLDLRAVPFVRRSWGLTAGFPVWRAARFAARALDASAGVVLAGSYRRPARWTLLLPGNAPVI